MNVDIVSVLSEWGAGAALFFQDSFFIAALKFFLFIYVMVLLADIVLLMIVRGISSDFKKILYGADRPLISRSTIIKRWEKILARLESENPSQYKVSILEADTLADEILDGIGFKGTTMGERLESVKVGQLETREFLVEAHQVRNRIVHESDFALSREEAEKWLNTYKKFFDEVELF